MDGLKARGGGHGFYQRYVALGLRVSLPPRARTLCGVRQAGEALAARRSWTRLGPTAAARASTGWISQISPPWMRLWRTRRATYGSIDVLVNNAAGVGLKDGRVDEISLEDWDAMFASGVRGPFYR